MSGDPVDILGVTPEPKDAQQGHHGQRDNECTESWTSPCYFGNHGDDQAGEQAFDNEVQHVCPQPISSKVALAIGQVASWQHRTLLHNLPIPM